VIQGNDDPNNSQAAALSSTTVAAQPTSTVPVTTTALPATTTTAAPTTTTSASTTTTTLGTAVPGTVLYEITDWSGGMNGWAASAQWKTVGGMLVADGTDRSAAVAPADLGRQQDYAVEAEIQIVDPTDYGQCYLQGRLINGDGYWGGYKGSSWQSDRALAIGYASDGMSSVRFPLDTGSHKYRLEVHENSVKLYLDGAEVVRGIDNRQLEPGTVGIFCGDDQVNIRSFRVIAM
jgi:hypothetical protein